MTQPEPAGPHIVLTWEQFVEQFKPIANPIDDNASLDGFMFETFGEELEFVKKANPFCIWTLVDDGESSEIQEGWHLVNRMGYLVTELPAAWRTTYSIDRTEHSNPNEDNDDAQDTPE